MAREQRPGAGRLPVAEWGSPQPMRRDAQRNAERILDVAARLIADGGVECLTMDAVAAEAGVGKGTVFRRFGSRTGLMSALTDHTERDFQQAFMSGPPPLGPGAPPLDRLLAFGSARLRLVAGQGGLMRATGGDVAERFAVPALQLATSHVRMLLRRLEVGGDVELLAQALLAPLDPALVDFQVVRRGTPLERLDAAWVDLARRVAAGPASP